MTMFATGCLAWIAVTAAACALDYQPDVGGLTAQVECSNADSDPATGVSFAFEIRPLLTRSPGGCSCHSGRVTSGFDVGSYESLRRGGINSGVKIIVAESPCESILPAKLSPTPPFGSRMPYNGPPYFTADEQLLVRDWIAEGALDN